MSLSMTVFTFINAWCITLFITIPFSVRQEEKSSSVEYVAAPRSMRWKKALLWNTVVSAVFTALLALIINSGIIPVKDMM